jgi:hypothetical protein
MLVKKRLIRVKDGWYNKPLIFDSYGLGGVEDQKEALNIHNWGEPGYCGREEHGDRAILLESGAVVLHVQLGALTGEETCS